ncbi:hypothetical protein DMJ13_22870 [halophilic archaeon]|nr:hypothetical protein DMJ13_22870 [halophilic archaeon]
MAVDETTATEAYADGTILTDVLGGHAKVKLLVALLSETDRDMNASDISRMAGIDRSTFYDHIDDLRAWGIVEQTRTVGNSKMYRLNTDSEAAKVLGKLEWELLEVLAEKEQAEELDEENRPILVE